MSFSNIRISISCCWRSARSLAVIYLHFSIVETLHYSGGPRTIGVLYVLFTITIIHSLVGSIQSVIVHKYQPSSTSFELRVSSLFVFHVFKFPLDTHYFVGPRTARVCNNQVSETSLRQNGQITRIQKNTRQNQTHRIISGSTQVDGQRKMPHDQYY